MSKQIPLPPFKAFLASNIPSVYDNTLSYYDELTKLIGYIETVILPAINETAGEVDGIKKGLEDLKSYVVHYFDNLDVQTEINNKLDAMAEDGTLAEIINQEIFDELNQKINNLEEISGEFPNFYVAPFFQGDLYGVSQHNVKFYTSLDGVNFTEFNKNADVNTGASNWLRDASLQWDAKNHRFIMSSLGYTDEYDALIYTSEDFVHWTEHKINLGYMVEHSSLHRWAPDLFIDTDGTIYLSLSVERTRVDSTYYFDQVLFKCTDDTNLTFTRVGTIILADTSSTASYIDGSFAKLNNVYYFIVKDEKTATTELYSTNSIESIASYARINNQMNFPGLSLEGGCICVSDDVVNVYAEDHANYHGYALMQTKKADFPTNYDNKAVFLQSLHYNTSDTNTGKYDARHGNVIYITDPEAKKIILNNTDISFTNTNALVLKNEYIDFYSYFGTSPSTVTVYPNVTYGLGTIAGDITIDNLINPYCQENIKFADSNQYGNIKINKINGVTRNINYQRRTNKFGDGITIMDFVGANGGRFRETQHYASLSNFTNAGADVTVTAVSGSEFNGVVTINFTITVNNTSSGEILIGTFDEVFRPYATILASHKDMDKGIYINREGKLYGNFTGVSANTTIACSATFGCVN